MLAAPPGYRLHGKSLIEMTEGEKLLLEHLTLLGLELIPARTRRLCSERRASERHSAAIAIESSTSVGTSGARNSSVGCFSDGRIDH